MRKKDPKKDPLLAVHPADVKYIKAADLVVHPENDNEGDLTAIIQSIQAHGWYGVIFAQMGTNIILAGNHRFRAARSLGMEEFPVILLDVDDEEALQILLHDNRTRDKAGFNVRQRALNLEKILEGRGNLEGTGYDRIDLSAYQRRIAEEDRPKVPRPEAPEKIQPPLRVRCQCSKCGEAWTGVVDADGFVQEDQ